MKVGQIDTIAEKYEADVFIQARWREPQLDWCLGKKINDDLRWDAIWNPDIVVQNVIDAKDKVWRDVQYTANGEAYILEKRRIKGEFTESMELHSFPFDTQSLSLTLTSETKQFEICEDQGMLSRLNHRNFADLQEWSAWDIVEFGSAHGPGELQPERPLQHVKIYVTRRSGFSIWNILCIMGLILSLGLCPWTISRVMNGRRLKLALTLILTTVTFKLVACSSLPKISYMTVLDKYIFTALIMLHQSAVYHALMGVLADETSEVANTVDMVAFIMFASLFVLFQVIFYGVVKLRIKRERKGLKLLEKQYKIRVNQDRWQAAGKRTGMMETSFF